MHRRNGERGQGVQIGANKVQNWEKFSFMKMPLVSLRHVHFGPRASEDFQHGTPILSYFAGQGNTNGRQDF